MNPPHKATLRPLTRDSHYCFWQTYMNNPKNSSQQTIRPLQLDDISILAEQVFPWSTPKETTAKWEKYWVEQQEGIRLLCIVEYQNQIAGYGNLLRFSKYPHFKDKKIPEINDLWIYDQYRKKGLATLLIHYLETIAANEGYHQIGLGVGLYSDYGSAQKLYTRLGYIPDGCGISYNCQATVPGKSYQLDDELLLWMIKEFP